MKVEIECTPQELKELLKKEHPECKSECSSTEHINAKDINISSY